MTAEKCTAATLTMAPVMLLLVSTYKLIAATPTTMVKLTMRRR